MTAPGPSGLVLVDKPAGMTSHDVVAEVRRMTGTRKVGHAGTLDPMATGVLVLGVNRATRLLGHLSLVDKTYDASIRLGQRTVTDDAEGEVVSGLSTADITEAHVRVGLAGLVGHLEQVPSSVSAVKIGGVRSYTRVRAGESVALPARPVTIHRIEVARVTRTGELLDVDVSVHCSTGTYVRAIARDLGEHLGVGGHLTRLRRSHVGPFSLDECGTLDEHARELRVLDMGAVAERCFATFALDERQAREVGYGRALQVELGAGGPVALLGPDGSLLALYEQRGPAAVPVAVLVG